MRIRHLAMAAGVLLAVASLSACQTASVDTAVVQNLPKACQALQMAHLAFTAIAASGEIKAPTVAKEAAAYSGVKTICVDPEHTTVLGAAILVATAYAQVSAALREAKAAK